MKEQQPLHRKLIALQQQFEGEILVDDTSRYLYATDASAYREIPLGVARPKNANDIRKLIQWAKAEKFSLIPRTAGTSLAGQVVGSGLVVDVSRHMTSILEINPKEKWVSVQPGVILDELNKVVEKHGLFFGPETSTSSRCMMGGMVGNNSCGAHSILYGSTRDHVISVKGFLSDGSEVEFRDLSVAEFHQKCNGETLENKIYRQIRKILSDPDNRKNICETYPDPSIPRRNTGYALDLLLDSEPFQEVLVSDDQTQNSKLKTQNFNFSKLIAGSEGTLMFITEIRLNLVPLPPKEKALICVHCHTVSDALKANLVALSYSPGSVELMDKAIMDCTLDNITQRQNRFFIEGDPGAILIIEFARETREEILEIHEKLESEMRVRGLGYYFPLVFPPDVKKVWELRKAGLGVLSNYPGDRKPVPVTEDTAVNPKVLPEYIDDFRKMLSRFGLACVYYAHAGSGELHLRPILNLKDPADVELFHTVALETARLVKKYKGSLSGEHGDGRLRGEFIPLMLGERNYQLFKEIKSLWDPERIFNPNKITDTPRMNTHLRFDPGKPAREIFTLFDFSNSHGILRATEQCNGSGDCRNTVLTGHWMCPSYMALKDENTTTRARANILREFLTNSIKKNPFDHPEIYAVMDLCLSCKACKSECPSNVDITKLKAEFLQHYYDAHGVPLRSRLIAYITAFNKLGSMAPALFNFFMDNRFLSGIVKSTIGFSAERNIPLLYRSTLRKWAEKNTPGHEGSANRTITNFPVVYLFADEFTNFNDVVIGIKAIKLLNTLGFRVILPDHEESGRTFLSKGLIRKAKKLANKNVRNLKDLITKETPLIGIEPSAILTFRDEYPDLVDPSLKDSAIKLAKNALLFDEFIVDHFASVNTKKPEERLQPSSNDHYPASSVQHPASNIQHPASLFTTEQKYIKLHGHCHQKALGSVETTRKMLSIPINYTVEEIKSGCCGMAGAFGYEKEHYEVSMKVGELVLFPEVRKSAPEVIIAAPGTSCRRQIEDGTGRRAFHPVEILYDALIDKE
ncbi:MAG: FAD-binding protein [Bacteroidales bacterium]|jgi:FAD/FMN-containing dehydrogenase/Fe-S oxidoreductase|nr:FAD-binding protein [Bacteroidales bacterium]